MQVNELRVGNWVNNKEEDYKITSATISQLERGFSIAEPILITEIWLIRFGFMQDENFESIWYLKNPDEEVLLWYDLDDNSVKVVNTWKFGKRKYVHEIQNLYYALMQEELEIKRSIV